MNIDNGQAAVETTRQVTPQQEVARLVERALSPPQFPSFGQGSAMEHEADLKWARSLREDVAKVRAKHRGQWPEGELHLDAVEATVWRVVG